MQSFLFKLRPFNGARRASGGGRSSPALACGVLLSSRQRGAVLLEVIISMGLLIFGMAVVGLQINAGLDAARTSDILTRGVMLADTKMAELAAGIVKPEKNDDEMKGDFGILYPGYSWRIKVKKTDQEIFNMITMEIGYNRAQESVKKGNPDEETDFEEADTRIIHTAYRLLPIPADVNLARDFGLTDEELSFLSKAAGGGGDGGENGNANGNGNGNANGDGAGGDNANAAAGGKNAAAGGNNPLNQLLENLGPLKDLKSFDPRMLASLPPDEFEKIAGLLSMLLGRGNAGAGTPEDLMNSLMAQVGGAGKQGGGGANGGGGNGPGGTDGNTNGTPTNDATGGGSNNTNGDKHPPHPPRRSRRGNPDNEGGNPNNDNPPGGPPKPPKRRS